MPNIDLFAGPGGWDEGLRMLGHEALGVEWDIDAARTAEAAGHKRLVADVAALDPQDFGDVEGLIASPPCQSFSKAGKGLGRKDKPLVIACAHELAAGHDTRATHRAACADERSMLTVEPLRWALALRPAWIAMEQVPAVLELWTLFGSLLAHHGYSVDVGVLSAEQYGVPQTRKRAYLVASRDRYVTLPAPTHQKYKAGEPAQAEGDLLPWVSMAEALGWDDGLVGFPRLHATESNASRESIVLNGTEYRARDLRSTTEQAFALTEKARSWQVWLRQNARANATVRRGDEPAPTITAGHDAGDRRWYSDRPATTAELQRPDWPCHRPATTVACDPRIFQPGGHHTQGSQSENAIRVTPEEAAALQGFPGGYPWQGTRTKQFQQIGNAVCPPVARVVLKEALA